MKSVLSYTKTPIVELHLEEAREAGVRILVKQEYLNHPHASGNKWWKLKYNLEEAARQNKITLLTFGGAYSNHIYATAAAANELGFKSVGIIRGEETLPLNSTLAFAKSKDMHLHYVSREAYKNKSNPDFIKELHHRFGEFYLIPEGGTSELAVKGTREWAEDLLKEAAFDYVCLPIGTGGTMAGIIQGMNKSKQVIGFAVLKDGNFLMEEIKKYSEPTNAQLMTEFHFGGYAKMTQELKNFIDRFEKEHHIPLDHVYTGKMMYGIYDLLKKGFFKTGTTVLVLHTGGLQGNP